MAKSQKTFVSHKIADAALKLAASRGWKDITLDQIAKAAKISVTQIKTHAAAKQDVLPLIVRATTARLDEICPKPSPSDPPRDRLFEVVMARFDLMQEHRKAMINIIKASRWDALALRAVIPAEIEAISAMARLVETKKSRLPIPLSAAGIGVVYGLVLHVWCGDETIDMSKTMAKLDRLLRVVTRIMSVKLPS